MKFNGICLLCLVVTLAACGGGLNTPEQRGATFASASLKIIRAEHLAMAGKLTMNEADLAADSAFHHAVKLDRECIEQWARAGESSCSHEIQAFLDAAAKIPDRAAPDDPASAIRSVLSEAPECASHIGPLLDGYAALFQLCLEMERDGTLLQDFMPVLIALGCPGTLKDLGLEEATSGRLKSLSEWASEMTAAMPYPTRPEHYYITFIKLNNWASKFSGQVTADTLATHYLAASGSNRVIGHLRAKGPMVVGFLGDSHMDKIHWSTQAPFPEIVGAMLQQINPEMVVVNAGKGGDDSGEGLARMDTALLARKPDITFVMFGGNDARHSGRPNPAVTPEQYRKNIDEIASRCRAAGSRVVLMNYPMSSEFEGPDVETFNGIRAQLRQAADSLGTSWLDIAEVLDQKPPEQVFAVDMIHFNTNTHIEIAGMVMARLAAMESVAEWNQKNQQ